MTAVHTLIYLSLPDVVALHALVMERTGFTPAPLRDEGLLESAMMRPRMAAHDQRADLIRQVAVLAVGISQAQAFMDGNQRTAFAACDVLLRLNGQAFRGDPLAMAQQLEAVAAREGDLPSAERQFEAWLREHTGPRGTR